MGYAVAEAALESGHEVTLISGPTALTPPPSARFVPITTSDELHDAVHAHVGDCDVLVMCAAVADYKPAATPRQKMEKQVGPFALPLIPTRDILSSLPHKRSYLVVGFAAQTHELEKNAMRKLSAKNCDVMIANDVSRTDFGMESDDNEVTIFFRNDDAKFIARAPKKFVAREILKIVFEFAQKSLTKKT